MDKDGQSWLSLLQDDPQALETFPAFEDEVETLAEVAGELNFSIATAFEEGTDGAIRNFQEALNFYLRSADFGHLEAFFVLGSVYFHGNLGVPPNIHTAAHFFWEGSVRNHPACLYNFGFCLEHFDISMLSIDELQPASPPPHSTAPPPCNSAAILTSRLDRAMPYYEQAAELGNALAQFRLGLAYLKSQGKQQDMRRAAQWFQMAADQGNADAAYNLGYLLDNGLLGRRDPQTAVPYYRQALVEGLPEAQFNLALCYLNGEGVQRDQSTALLLMRQAAQQGLQLAVQWTDQFDKKRTRQTRKRTRSTSPPETETKKQPFTLSAELLAPPTSRRSPRKTSSSSQSSSVPSVVGSSSSSSSSSSRSAPSVVGSSSSSASRSSRSPRSSSRSSSSSSSPPTMVGSSSSSSSSSSLSAEFDSLLEQAGLWSFKDKLIADGADMSTIDVIDENDLVRLGVARLKARKAAQVIRSLVAPVPKGNGVKRQRAG